MFPADLYIIRLATDADAATVRRLAALDSAKPLTGRVLIGEIDGKPAAAVSIDDGRVVADPFQLTAQLVSVITMRRRALLSYAESPSLPSRIRQQIRFAH